MSTDNIGNKTAGIEVPVENEKKLLNKLSLSILSILVVILSIFALNFKCIFTIPAYYYIKLRYLPENILDHYIKNPLGDVSFKVPVYFDSEMKFPDLPESVDIQINSRMYSEFYPLLNYSIELIPSSKDKFFENQYPIDDMFINCVLNDGNAIQIDGAKNFAELYFNLEGIDANDIPFFMTQLLIDHCFKDEILKYCPSNFLKSYEIKNFPGEKSTFNNITNTDNHTESHKFHFVHADEFANPFLLNLLTNNTVKSIINLEIHVIGGNTYRIEMEKAIKSYMEPTLSLMSQFYDFNITLSNIDIDDVSEIRHLQKTDDIFPVELTSLPFLWELYQSTNYGFQSNDKKIINQHMVFFPFVQGGEFIKQLKVDDTAIYSDVANTYLKIGDWGSIYFSHLGTTDEFLYILENDLKDCIWSYEESLFDILGLPSGNMSPEVRIKIYKRYLIMQFLTHYSKLLSLLKNKINWDWNNLTNLFNVNPLTTKYLAESFTKSVELRQVSINLAKDDNLDESLIICKKMVNLIQKALTI